ncbi:hypothetical protein HAL013_01220 [Helicobacter ailurogastricus]|uniref:Uncharacterized protein n=1 Tax=Helicobacter ailurogastricus TaxID=1578720 RepID=A0A0K2X8U3_9HELI|nr:hypothetical protein HAL013_01220 [Helicobacter ailurogastricus]
MFCQKFKSFIKVAFGKTVFFSIKSQFLLPKFRLCESLRARSVFA